MSKGLDLSDDLACELRSGLLLQVSSVLDLMFVGLTLVVFLWGSEL